MKKGKADHTGIGKLLWWPRTIMISIILFVSASLYLSLRSINQHAQEEAYEHASTMLNMDMALLMWNIGHGGVYVPVSSDASSIQDKDAIDGELTTQEGIKLTPINPELMLRQIHENENAPQSIAAHIVSINSNHSITSADAWEAKAIKKLEGGEHTVSSVELWRGEPHLRMVKPLITEETCLKCHDDQGLQVGDIQGGISISLPLASFIAGQRDQHFTLILTHLVFGLLGIGLVAAGNRLIVRHASEQNRAILRFQRGEQQLLELVRRLPMPAHLIDKNEKVMLMNDAFKRVFGYAQEDFLESKQWWPTVYPDPDYRSQVKQLWKDYVQKVLSGKAPDALREIRVKTKTGEYRIVDFNLSKFGDRGLVLLDDVTDRINRERLSLLRQQRLQLMGSALNAAANGVVITDTDANIQWINQAFTRITGYSKWECMGKNPNLLKSGHQNEAFYRKMWETLTSGEVWKGTLVNKRKNGELYEEEMTITPVRGSDDTITHYIAIKNDVTERNQLERQFLRSQRMESLGLLAGGVAHDLNNVLSPILLSLDLMAKDIDAEKKKRMIANIRSSCERGAAIIKQILAFSRGLKGEHVPVQIRHLIKDLTKFAEETFPKTIEIESNIPRNLSPTSADATQIHQVLLNLALNAKDAMPDGGKLTIHAEEVMLEQGKKSFHLAIDSGPYIHITIQDTGTGMPPEIAQKIFDPFFTTKPMGKGTGLGLSTVMGVLKNHHGLIELETEHGKGSTFNIWLPITENAAPKPKEAVRELPPQGNGECILVVDDEASLCKTVKTVLEQHGYKTLLAQNGAEAVTIFTEHMKEISLVLTDILMPVMNGVDLTRSLQRLRPDIRIIGASGYLGESNKTDLSKDLMSLGVRVILKKPFPSSTLLKAIHETLTTK